MRDYPKLKFQLLSENAVPPVRGTEGSSGLDVFSPIDINVPARGDALIPLDIRFDIPFGWDLAVYNKSGVAMKKKLSKGAELIDSDYRGTVHIHFFNNSDMDVAIKKGDKISQLVMREVWMGELEQVDEISTETVRGAGGFGSTGTTVISSDGSTSGKFCSQNTGGVVYFLVNGKTETRFVGFRHIEAVRRKLKDLNPDESITYTQAQLDEFDKFLNDLPK